MSLSPEKDYNNVYCSGGILCQGQQEITDMREVMDIRG